MTNPNANLMNGKFLYNAFIAGGNQILKKQSQLNKINVFPVNDKDTGTNLASTIRSVMDNTKPHESYKTTINDIAHAALMGARGNSGIIFAQFLYGLNQETLNKPVITLTEFVESVKKSIPYLYEAIANPVEGTMLTVIKDWSCFISEGKDSIHNFAELIIASLPVLEKSLAETTTKLKALHKSGFVDAGAKGFVLFMKGVIEFIKHRNLQDILVPAHEKTPLAFSHDFHELTEENIPYRFCTEAILKNLRTEKIELEKTLRMSGDSVVIAGSKDICRIHLHTNHPSELFYQLREYGTITFQKVDDMVRQQEIKNNRKWNIAIVTDSTCDLSQDLIDFYQINMLPMNLNFGENYYLDKVTMQPNQFYQLLESEREFPKTSQINQQAFTNVYSHLASHYDAIIAIHLSSQFSGTYQSSLQAGQRVSKEFKKPIYVIDSKSLSGALGLLVLKTAQNIEAGKSIDSIVRTIQEDVAKSKIFVSVPNLHFMIKGGRVSKPKGFIAQALGLNPIITMDKNGKSLLFGKTFSQQASLKKILKHIESMINKKVLWNYMVLHAHNFDGAQWLKEKMIQITKKKPIAVINISPVIGMHAGRGALAVSLLVDN